MGNRSSATSASSSVATRKAPPRRAPRAPPAAATLSYAEFDLALYALYTRGVCVAERAQARGELRPDTALGGAPLLQDCLLVAIVEVLNEPNQPTFEPGICLLPGQTVAVTRAKCPPPLRPIFALAERVKHLLQKAEQQRRRGLRRSAHQHAAARKAEGAPAAPDLARRRPVFSMADLRAAAFLTPEEQASAACDPDVHEILSQVGLIISGFFRVRNHRKIQRAAMIILRASPVLSGRVRLSARVCTVPVRPIDASTLGVAWVNVDLEKDTVSSVLKKIRVTSQVDDSVDTRLTDVRGNALTDEHTLMAHAAAQKVIVVHADALAQSEQVVFLSRVLVGNDDDDDDDDDHRYHQTATNTAATATAAEGTTTLAKIPQVPGHLILGNVADVQRLGIHAAADKWIRAHGDIVKVRFLGQDAFVVRRATFARQVLARQNKLAPPTHVGGGSEGLFFADAARHDQLRRDLNPCFYRKSIALLYEDLLQTVNEFVDCLKHRGIDRNEDLDFWQWSVRLFYDGMARAGLGCGEEAVTLREIRDRGGKRASYPKILRLFEYILEAEKKRQIVAGGPMPWMNDLPTPANIRYNAACRQMYKEAARFVEIRLQKREAAADGEQKGSDRGGDAGQKRYFLDACLDGHGENHAAGFMAARAQVLNFFRAGTDTTAASLCWTLIELSQHPEVEKRLLKEIDAVLAPGVDSAGNHDAGTVGGVSGADETAPPRLDKLWHGMPYLDALLKEVMRHHPPANVLIRGIDGEDLQLTCEAGKVGHDGKSYVIPKGSRVMVDIIGLHKDPRYWRNATVFDPSRFLAGDPNFEQVESGGHIPFGGGPRTCIGNLFGLLEVKLAIVQLLRSFTLESIGEPVTVTPGEEQKPATGATLRMRPRRRGRQSSEATAEQAAGAAAAAAAATAVAAAPPLTSSLRSETFRARSCDRGAFAFGSNQGTCQAFAEQLAATWMRLVGGDSSGPAVPLDALDMSGLLDPARAPSCLLICTSTYNGAPPENARAFVASLRELLRASSTGGGDARRPLAHLAFSVFGSGNSNWGSTFQQIPDEVNRTLRDLGAQPIFPMAVADAAEGPMESEEAFTLWMQNVWAALGLLDRVYDSGGESKAEDTRSRMPSPPPMRGVFSARPSAPSLRTRTQTLCFSDLRKFKILDLRRLTPEAAGTQEVCHITLAAAHAGEPLNYHAGDHLEVGAAQPPDVVERLCLRLGLNPASAVAFHPSVGSGGGGGGCDGGPASASPGGWGGGIETGVTYPVREVLSGRDISVSQRTLRRLAQSRAAADPDDAARLQGWADLGKQEFATLQQERGLLNLCHLLKEFASVHISLEELVCHYTTPLRRRYYSISSAPHEQAGKALFLTVGVVDEQYGEVEYHGVSSWGLTRPRRVGGIVDCKIHRSTFRLPADPATPVIFACGGTGIAPFRAFWHERARSRSSAKTILYFGCRDRRHLLYADEIEGLGDVVDLRLALSREPGTPKTYVQHKMLEDRAELFDLLTRADKPASVYVCGSVKRIGAGVHDALVEILTGGGGGGGGDATAMSPADARDWLADAEHTGHYHRDVWG